MSSEQAWLLLSRARQKSHSNCRNVAELPASADVVKSLSRPCHPDGSEPSSTRRSSRPPYRRRPDARCSIKLLVALSTECHPIKARRCAGIIAPTPSPKDAPVVITIV
ncbi:hypothetical protein DAI22_12g171200 [Oryza sativa Japonica Group]|nr:hypothetical protein DAI22_12g171200 [Oryza sativa Japonica Group]